MATSKIISPQWQAWLQENLARGCDHESILQAMEQRDFTRKDAQELIQRFSTHDGEEFIYGTPIFESAESTLNIAGHVIELRLRLAQPRIVVFDQVLSALECDELIRLSKVKLSRSTIVDPITGREEIIRDRSSSGTFFNINENAFIASLDQRVSQLMQLPVENGEGLQILNYQVGGEYKPHFDFFPPTDAGSAHHLSMGGQRVSTLVIYLNEPTQGGETSFPEVGLSVVPKKGSAVYFEYTNPQGQVDRLSLHAGEPVRSGEKWIATKWMRQGKYGNV